MQVDIFSDFVVIVSKGSLMYNALFYIVHLYKEPRSGELCIDEVTNDVTSLHSGRPLLFYAGENNTQCL